MKRKTFCVYCFRNLVATSIDVLKEKIRNNIHDLTTEARITENSGDFTHFYLYRQNRYELEILKSNDKFIRRDIDLLDLYNNLDNLEEYLNDQYKFVTICCINRRDEFVRLQNVTRNGTKIPEEWQE